MKTKIRNSKKIGLLLLVALLVSSFVKAAGTYTAVASGKWSSSTTWGATPPPFSLAAGDQVTISSGITVTMDSNVTINGLLAEITVTGTLQSASNIALNVTTGTLTGAGTINAGNVMLNAGGTFSFTGSLTAQTITNAVVSLSSSAIITANQSLSLMGILSVQTGGTFNIGAGGKIIVSGGQLDLSGGTLGLSSTYDVDYTSVSATTGMELSGSGLRNVNINAGAGNTVTLGSNLVVNDSLELTSSTLALNGSSLTINGPVSGSASLTGDAAADVIVNTSGGIKVPLMFAAGAQMLNNLTVNIGSGNSLMLSSGLSIEGTLGLSAGDLNINGDSLVIDGTLGGSGKIDVNSSSSVTINTAGSVTTPVILSGTSIGNFTVNVGSGNTVTLGSNLAVAGILNLQSGTLVLNANNLSVSGDIAASGSGSLFSTASSNVPINTATSASGALAFSYPGNVVNNFTVNIGAAGSVTMGSNVVIKSNLNLMAGNLSTGSFNVEIAPGGTITGATVNSYVKTGASGYLTMHFNSTGVMATFPVGTASAYFPASITLNTGSDTGAIGVNVSAGVYAQGTSGTEISTSQPMVNATWLFQNTISSGLNYNMQLAWAPAAEVNGFVHTNDYISHYTSGAWDVSAYEKAMTLGSGMYGVQRANLTSMSPFAVFDSTTSPAGINEIAFNDQFRVYPNPAADRIYVKNSWGNELVYADIVNMCGQTLGTFRIENASTFEIPVKELSNGVYFLRLYNEKMNVIQKFIKAD